MDLTSGIQLPPLSVDVVSNTSEFEKGLDQSSKQAVQKVESLGKQFSAAGDKMTKYLTLPILGAGAALGKIAYDTEMDLVTLGGRLGTTAEETENLKKIAQTVYKNGFGESLEDCVNGLVNLQQNIKDTANMTDEQKQKLLEQISTMKTLFKGESEEITKTVNNMKQNGIIDSVQEGLDVITRGFQEGLNSSGDLLDVLYEYSPQFKKLGLDGSESLAYIKAGLDAGAYNADKMADALKELSIRAIDGSTTTIEGFTLMGKNADEMARKFAQGGDTAKAALHETIEGLKNMKDPLAQDKAAVDLFGTQWEDSSKQAILAMGDVTSGLDNVTGATEKAGEEVNNSIGNQFTVALREAKDAAMPLGKELLVLAKDNMPILIDGVKSLSKFTNELTAGQKKSILTVAAITATAGPLLKTVGTGIELVNKTKTGLNLLSTAMKATKTGTETATTAVGLFNKTLTATPWALVATAAISFIAILAEYEDRQREASEETKQAYEVAMKNSEAYVSMKNSLKESEEAIISQSNNTQMLWKELQTLADENGNVEEKNRTRAQFIIEQLNPALGTEITMVDGQIQKYGELITQIDQLIAKKRAEAILDTQKEAYAEALSKVDEIMSNQVQTTKSLAEEQKKLKDVEDEFNSILNDSNLSYDERQIKLKSLKDTQEQYRSEVTKLQDTYTTNEGMLKGYYDTIGLYTDNYTAAIEGNYNKIKTSNNLLSNNYRINAEDVKGITESQVTDLETKAQLLRAALNANWGGITEDMVIEAENNASKAREEYSKVGKSTNEGLKSGIDGNKSLVTNSFWEMMKETKVGTDISGFWDIGKSIVTNVAGGITANKGGILDAINNSLKFQTSVENLQNGTSQFKAKWYNANGKDFVPYDGYTARLHKGERVLTAKENEQYTNNINNNNIASGEIVINNNMYLDGEVAWKNQDRISGTQSKLQRRMKGL